MLRFVFTDTEGKEHTLTRPLRVTLRMDEDVPADDLYAVFVYTAVGELKNVRLYDDETLLFIGVIDEQEQELCERGRFLKISARSTAAHLLDNEAEPGFYDHPAAALIYERHIKPYGIRWEKEDDATYYGELPINKGMSQWAVLKAFCNACFSSSPRVTADGMLQMKEPGEGETAVFSDDGDGIAYTKLRQIKKRCEELSRINVKISDTDGYRHRIENSGAIARGVRRERYLNAALASTPMTCADTMLRRADRKSFGIVLECPGRLTDLMSRGAVVKNRLLGKTENLHICGVGYRLDEHGETTTLHLKRRDFGCGSQDT